MQDSNLAVMRFQFLKCFEMTLVILVQVVSVRFFISEHAVVTLWHNSGLHSQIKKRNRKQEAMKVGPNF
jgi:hypothetical protein